MAKANAVAPAAWSGPERALLAQVSGAHFVSHFHIMTLPAMIPLMPNFMNVSLLDIGLALSVFNIVGFISQTPMGFATDRFGARNLLLLGLLLGGASFLLIPFFPSYACLIIAMIGAGLANGVYHPADYALLSGGIASHNIGRAFSVHTFFGYAGAAAAPAILLPVATHAGLPMAFAVSGGISLLIAIVVATSRTLTANARQRSGPKTGPISLRALLTPSVAMLTLFFLVMALSTYGIQDFSVTALISGYSVPLPVANAALTTFLFCTAFGVLAGGIVADRTKRHGYVASIALILAACAAITIASISMPHVIMIALMGFIGLMAGAIAPSRDILVRSVTPAGAEGRIFGIVSTGGYIGAAIAPLLFASLLEARLPWSVFIIAAGFMGVTATITAIQERSMRRD